MPYANPNDAKAWQKRYRKLHQPEFRRYSKQYVDRNPEKRRETCSKYYQRNKEKIRIYEQGRREQHRRDCRKYYMKNPEVSKRYYVNNKPRIQELNRKNHLKRTFGLTDTEYNAMLVKQHGRCAICGNEPRKRNLHVDHNHLTNEIRGLLCHSCNNGLGLFRDDPKLLLDAIGYLIEIT